EGRAGALEFLAAEAQLPGQFGRDVASDHGCTDLPRPSRRAPLGRSSEAGSKRIEAPQCVDVACREARLIVEIAGHAPAAIAVRWAASPPPNPPPSRGRAVARHSMKTT